MSLRMLAVVPSSAATDVGQRRLLERQASQSAGGGSSSGVPSGTNTPGISQSHSEVPPLPSDTGGSQSDASSSSSDPPSTETSSSPSVSTSVSSSTPSSTPSSTSSSSSSADSTSVSSASSSSSLPPTSSSSPTSSTSLTSSTQATTSSSSSTASSVSSSSLISSSSAASTSSSSQTSSTSSLTTSTPSSSTTTSLSSNGSGVSTSTGTKTIVETVNGHPTTTLVPFTTTLSAPTSTTSDATNKSIIAGSVVGVAAFLALALAMIVFYRRHQNKKLNFFSRKQAKPRSMLLAGEDMDDYDLHGPSMQSYQDFPASSSAASRSTSYNAGSLAGHPLPPNMSHDAIMQSRYSPSPHLMGMRTSESGSMFQEAVWPPPKSAFIDPLLAASSDDLHRIVDDVMGPASSGGPSPRAVADESDPRGGLGMHTRATSQTTLIPRSPDSPRSPSWQSPLFVTNMGTETASVRTAASPPPGARSRLGPSHPGTASADDAETYPMGEAL